MRQPPGTGEEFARWTLDGPPQLRTLRANLQEAAAAATLPAPPDAADLAATLRAPPDAADLTARSPAPPDTADLTEVVERLMIVATELAGNALRHGRPPTVVALRRAGGHLLIDVVDHDPESRPVVDAGRPAGTGGLGLPLAERLAQEVGWYPAGTAKHVWATFTLPQG
jgi:signal transduction histidine kinase